MPQLDREAAAAARAETMTRDAASGVQERRAILPGGLGAARSLAFPVQLRATLETRKGQQLYHLSGIASVTDTPYEMWDFAGPYDEIVARRAFDDTLASDPDVAFLVNHRGVTMARTTNGTLELAMGDAGLRSEAWLNPKRQDVTDLVLAIEDRDIDEMSFAFMLEEGRWSEDFTTFTITRLDINRGDVSAVNYGANPYTSIAARSREILDELGRLPVGLARAAMTRLQERPDLCEPEPVTPQSDGAPVGARQTGRWLSALDAWIATVEAT
jgi:HK97 family phage prohead protease